MIILSISERENWRNRKLTNAYAKVVYHKHGISNRSKKNFSTVSGPHLCGHLGGYKKVLKHLEPRGGGRGGSQGTLPREAREVVVVQGGPGSGAHPRRG